MHPIDDAELMSKFSSDGEESFIGCPGPSSNTSANVQNLTSPYGAVNETSAEEELGIDYSPRPTSRLRPSALFSRLTSKLRINTPPNSPPATSPSFNLLSPTRPCIPEIECFTSKEFRPLLERGGLLFPQDMDTQEREQDGYIASIGQDDILERQGGKKRTTESNRMEEQWEAKNQGASNDKLRQGNSPVRPPRPKGPFYPAVLATPQFGTSKSTPPDMVKPVVKLETGEMVAHLQQPRLPTLAAPSALRPPQETPPLAKSPIREDSRRLPSLATSSSLSRHTQKWPHPPPNRSLPPIPTNDNRSPAHPISPIADSSVSSRRYSFVTDGPFTQTSRRFAPDTPSTPASPGHGDRNASKREDVSEGCHVTVGRGRDPGIHGASLTMNSRARSGESSYVGPIVAGTTNRDAVKSTFFVKRSNSGEQGKLKIEPVAQAHRRPRTADPPKPKTSEITNSSPDRSQRRKSSVGQSLHNLRKSVTDTITRARPKTSTPITSTSLLTPRKYDVSRLPPLPTFPFPPSAGTVSHRR